MISNLVEAAVDAITDLISGGDAVEGLDSDAVTGGSVLYGQPMPPISSEVQSTLNLVNNVGEDVAAIEGMSPEALAEYTEDMEARNAMMGSMTDGQVASSEISSSVGKSMSNIAESDAKSYALGGYYTPFEEGITLADSSVSHDISEFEQHASGLLEKDGQYYKEYADGVYHPTDADGAWL